MSENKIGFEIKGEASAKGFDALNREIEQLETALRKTVDQYEAASKRSITLRSEMKKLIQSGQGTEAQFANLTKRIEQSQKRELDAIETARTHIRALDAQGGSAAYTADEISKLNRRLDESEGWITGLTPKVKQNAKSMRELSGAVTEVGEDVRGLGGDVRNVSGEVVTLGDRLTATREKILQAGFNVMADMARDALQTAVRATIEFVNESNQAFSTFEKEFSYVFAQIPNLSGQMRTALQADVLAISQQVGYLPEEVIPALRKAMNLGIGEDTLLDDFNTAATAARVNGAELTETLVAGRSVVNAYGEDVVRLADVYDQFTFIIQNSNLEQQDLNNGMNQIISAAAEADVGLSEVAGAMVTMSKQGDDAAEIAELLSTMLTQINIEGTALGSTFRDAAGQSFSAFKAQGGTLIEAMQLLQEHANRTGQSLQSMVGGSSGFYRDIQAARAVMELTGSHLEELAIHSDEATRATNLLNDAYGEVEDTMFLVEARMDAATAALKKQIGEALAPGRQAWLEFWTAAAGTLTESLSRAEADAQIRAEFEAAGLSGRELATAMHAVRNSTGLWREEWATSQEMLERAPYVLEQVQKGFDGTSGQLMVFTSELVANGRVIDRDTQNLMAYYQWLLDTETATRQLTTVSSALNLSGDAYETAEDIAAANAAIEEQMATRTALIVQARTAAQAFGQAGGALNGLFGAETDEQLLAAQSALLAQLQTDATDLMLAEQGLSDASIAAMVATGQLTDEQARLQLAFMQAEDALPLINQAYLDGKLSAEEYATAIETLHQRLLETPEEKTIRLNLEAEEFAARVADPEATAWRERLGLGEEVEELTVGVGVEFADAALLAAEEELQRVVGADYIGVLELDNEPGLAAAQAAEREFIRVARTYAATITANVVTPDDVDPTVPGFSQGGDFVVPKGYPDDSYLMAVTSDEHVTVRTQEQQRNGSGGGVTINLTIAGGGGSAAATEQAAYSGLNRALAEAGLR